MIRVEYFLKKMAEREAALVVSPASGQDSDRPTAPGQFRSFAEEDSMTLNEKNLVLRSFAQVMPIAETAAELFYGRLFELDPTLRPMFRGDMREQGRKLMQMLAVAVHGLDRLHEILPAVRAMGRRHAGYGVTDDHYDTVASALLWTLEQGLGEQFTPDVKSAWASVYTVLANAMKSGAMEQAGWPTRESL
jgi:hemoglobin-like flavoprotein